MEHVTDESHRWRFIRILFCEFDSKFERTILKGCIVRAKYHGIPYHNIIVRWRTTNTRRWIFLQTIAETFIVLAIT